MSQRRHLVLPASQAQFLVPDQGWARGAEGFGLWTVLDGQTPAVHTGFGLCELAPGGSVPAHVHSFEESVFVVDGDVVLQTAEGAVRLGAGDYGLVPVGTAHSFRNDADRPVRWAQMLAPQPRRAHDDDTFAVAPLPVSAPRPVNVRDPRNRLYGHIAPENMDVDKQSQDMLAVSASMRTALLAYSGISVKMMVDSDLGAELATMFMVQYAPDGVAGRHDHPFEEVYYFLDGESDAEFDGEVYRLGPGDVAFAGVGCVHAFRNAGQGRLRWLETQAPQPPRRHSYRFARDWDYLRSALEKEE